MYRITGKIKGIVPILFNRPDPDVLEPPIGGIGSRSGGRKTHEQRMEEALRRLHQDGDGIFVPAWMFKRTIIEGGAKSGLKVNKSKISNFLPAEVFPDFKLYFGKTKPDFIHEHWGRVPPRTGAAVIVRRPAFKEGWILPFGMSIVDDRRSPDEVRRCLDEAGLLVGMGAWRPEYGRFLVIDWKIEKEKK